MADPRHQLALRLLAHPGFRFERTGGEVEEVFQVGSHAGCF